MSARDLPVARRALTLAVLVLLSVGSAMLWIAIPLACLWLSAKASNSLAQHFLLALPMTIAAMLAWGVLLAWLNQVYLSVTGVLARVEEDERAGWTGRRVRGPLEPLLAVSFVMAFVAFLVWFFAYAQNPPTFW